MPLLMFLPRILHGKHLWEVLSSSVRMEVNAFGLIPSSKSRLLQEQKPQYLKEHKEDIADLLRFVEPEAPKSGTVSGKSFCFSGGFEDGKRYWEDKVQALGAKCVSGVSKKTNFLVAGPGSGSKSEKAKKLGIPIIDVEELRKMLS